MESQNKSILPSGYAYFHGRILPVEEVQINILTHAFLYGTAVFEGIRAYQAAAEANPIYIFRPAEHFQRLKRSAAVFRMRLPETTAALVERCRELIRGSGYRTDVYLRVVHYKSARRIGVRMDGEEDFVMIAVPMGGKYHGGENAGVRAAISSWRRIEDNAIPSRAKVNGSYANLALSIDEVQANGFDEPLLLNEDGHLSEAAGMNVFLVRQGALVTSGVEANILEGVTRDTVMILARKELGIETLVRPVDRSEIYGAEEVFLCGTGAEILPVVEVDRRPIGTGEPGPISREIIRIYGQVVRGALPAYESWLVPV